MNQQEMQVDVLLNFNDYLRANYWFLFKKSKGVIFLLLLAGVGYPLLSVVGVIPKNPEDNYWGLLIPWSISLLIFGATYFGAKRQMASNKFLNEAQHYTFDNEGVHYTSASSSGFEKWENIREAFETKTNFLLLISLNQMYILPKRCFQDAEQVGVFKKLLRQHLGTKLKAK